MEEWTQGQTAWGGADFKKQQLILLFFGADSSRMMMIIWVHNINIHTVHTSQFDNNKERNYDRRSNIAPHSH
jgi:hypothetical protein